MPDMIKEKHPPASPQSGGWEVVKSFITRAWDLVSFGEPQSPAGGGRFLPRFTTDWGFLSLRVASAVFLLCLQQPPWTTDGAIRTAVVSATYAAAQVLLFVIRRFLYPEKANTPFIITQTLLDVAFATSIGLLRRELGASTVVLYLIGATEASLLGPFVSWLSVTLLAFLSGGLVAIHAGGPLYLLPAAILGALMLVLRVYRGTQVKTKASLERERSRYESLVDHIPQMITRKDLNGVITYANKAFCALNRLTREEILGRNDAFLYGSDTAQQYLAGDAQVIASGHMLRIDEEHRPYRQDAEKRVEGWKIPVFDSSGNVAEIQVVFLDVTERVRNEIQLGILMETIPDHIYFKDAQSRFLTVSKSLATCFGAKAASEVIGKTDYDFFTPDHADKAHHDERQIMTSGQPIIAKEEKETWPDKKVTWVLTTKQCLRDPNGKVVGTFGISRDITERKQKEEELRLAYARYPKLVQNAQDVIYTHDLQGTFTSINKAGERLLGWPAEELKEKRIDDIVVPEERERIKAQLFRKSPRQGLKTSRYSKFSMSVLGRDGVRRELEVLTHLVRADRGEPPDSLREPGGHSFEIQGIARDVTERNKAHREMAKALQEQTWVITEVKARAQAEHDRIAEIHHRVSNDLDIIATYVERGPKELSSVIHGMYLLHRQMYAGEETLSLHVYIEKLVRRVLQVYGRTNIEPGFSLAEAHTFPGHAAQAVCVIIVELVTNALKHNAQDGLQLNIGLIYQADTGYTLTVQDNGSGIPHPPKREGMGFPLVHSWARTFLHGNACYESSASGTAWRIDFNCDEQYKNLT
jgi:PAS domain S-box-containing protein